jgi:osmoprotectant transport system ATP-binding protein
VIKIDHITKKFDDVLAVDDLSLEIESGLVCVLIGPSGSGKTTLLRMINRLIEPTSGEIYLNGLNTRELKPEKLRQSIGYAIQSVGLFPHMTVSDNIAVVPEMLGWDKKRIAGRVAELLSLVDLDPETYACKYPAELSGGEAQRIGVARALAGDPPVLLMDEPFGAVDPLSRQKLQLEFVRIQKKLKKTVLLVTHDLDEAIRLADRVAIIQSGRLIQYDTPEALLSNPNNKFVHDFIGADRALKRLSLISVEKHMRPACSINVAASVRDAEATICQESSIWITGAQGKFLGWINRNQLSGYQSLAEATVYASVEDIAIINTSTLRHALSLMLGQGVRSIPVVDENGRLLGELNLGDVEKVTAEIGVQNAP